MIILLLTIFLVGCNPTDFWNDLKNLQFVRKPSTQTNTTNQSNINETNTTTINITTQEIQPIENGTHIFITSNSVLVIENNISYLIDSPKDNFKMLQLITELKRNEMEFIVVTIDKEDRIGGIPNIVTKSPPKIVYDNGIENEYRTNYVYRLDRYNTYWNRTATVYPPVLDDFSNGNFNFFVPFSRGLSTIKEENSIVVYTDKFLYMSDCYGECEKKIPPIKTTYLILANNGKCPTNTFDFIIGTRAEYVIGDEICQSLKNELELVGIGYLLTNEKRIIHIIIESDKVI